MHQIKISVFCRSPQRKYPEDSKKEEYHPEIAKISKEYKDVFPKALPKGIPPERGENFDIKFLSEVKQENKPIYRIVHKKQEVRSNICELTEHEFIIPNASPLASSVLFISKKDVSLRFCVECWWLNAVTVQISNPIPSRTLIAWKHYVVEPSPRLRADVAPHSPWLPRRTIDELAIFLTIKGKILQ